MGAAIGNSLDPASARAVKSPPNNKLPDRNNPAAPRNQIPRRGAATESPQTASAAAAWSNIKLAAVCNLGSDTSCAPIPAKMIPLAPVSPAKAEAANTHFRRLPALSFVSRGITLSPLPFEPQTRREVLEHFPTR